MEQIALKIPSSLHAVRLLGQLVGAICSFRGLTQVEASQVEVCVVEAVNNSIKHAYKGAENREIELEVRLLPDQLVFDVLDSGASADPIHIHADHSHAFEVDLSRLDEMPESGRGLAIIQGVMDSFEYTPGKDRNRFRLVKKLKGRLRC